MKTTKLFKYTAGLLIFSIVTVIAACGNKNDSAPVVVQQQNVCGVNMVCPGQVTGNTLFQAESTDWYNVVKLNWNFLAQNAIQAPFQNTNGGIYGGGTFGGMYNSPIITYSGPVAVSGAMTLTQTASMGMCQLPAGSYVLSTVTPGQWMSAMVYGVRMQATGPATVMLSLQQGQVSAKTGSQLGSLWSETAPVGRIFGNIMIESVGGYPCNMSILVQ